MIKPFLADKIMSTERITLTDNGEVVRTEQDNAMFWILNFFSNIVTNLKIPEQTDYDPIVINISDPILKLILRYRNHPSILTIGEACNKSQKFSFSFSQVEKKDILDKIQRLDIKKRLKNQTFPPELLKNSDTSLVTFCYQVLMMQ